MRGRGRPGRPASILDSDTRRLTLSFLCNPPAPVHAGWPILESAGAGWRWLACWPRWCEGPSPSSWHPGRRKPSQPSGAERAGSDATDRREVGLGALAVSGSDLGRGVRGNQPWLAAGSRSHRKLQDGRPLTRMRLSGKGETLCSLACTAC